MILRTLVSKLILEKEDEVKVCGDEFEVDEKRAKEILKTTCNGKPVVELVSLNTNTDELEKVVKELEAKVKELESENKKLTLEKEKLEEKNKKEKGEDK